MSPRATASLLLLAAAAALASGCENPEAAPPLRNDPPAAPSAAPDAPDAPASDAPLTIEQETLTVSAVGDCTLGTDYRVIGADGTFHKAMDDWRDDYSIPFANVLPVLGADDLTIANLEGPLSNAKPTIDAAFVFNGKPEYANVLAKGGVDLVTVANNHALDYGQEGAQQTLDAVEKVGVGAFGSGRVDVRTIKGIEVINLGYMGGGSRVRDRVVKDVQKRKRDDNLVIVSFHWGVEGLHSPIDDQRILAHAVIDAGANLILGHHPHVLQGIETYQGRHIVYSLGNFVFGGNSNPPDKDSMIYQEMFAKEGGIIVSKGNRILPVRISSVTAYNDFQPVLLEGDDKERVLSRVRDYGALLAPPPPPR